MDPLPSSGLAANNEARLRRLALGRQTVCISPAICRDVKTNQISLTNTFPSLPFTLHTQLDNHQRAKRLGATTNVIPIPSTTSSSSPRGALTNLKQGQSPRATFPATFSARKASRHSAAAAAATLTVDIENENIGKNNYNLAAELAESLARASAKGPREWEAGPLPQTVIFSKSSNNTSVHQEVIAADADMVRNHRHVYEKSKRVEEGREKDGSSFSRPPPPPPPPPTPFSSRLHHQLASVPQSN